jgi:hypothetical protein
VPYWFLALSAMSSAALPWLPRRFSLKSVLIAMTLVAVGMGIVVYLTRQ